MIVDCLTTINCGERWLKPAANMFVNVNSGMYSAEKMHDLPMNYLSLDIGRKHTGVAFCDSIVGIPLPLDTIYHQTDEVLAEEVSELISKRKVETLIAGLPLMPSGEEGEEVEHVRFVCGIIQAKSDCPIEFLDERETSRNDSGPRSEDVHAHAAVKILTVYLERAR